MKCALDFTIIKAEAEAKYEEELRLEKEKKARALQEAKERTIKFCETQVNMALEEAAKSRKNGIFYYFGDKDYFEDDNYLYPLTEKKKFYADGRSSFNKDDYHPLCKKTLIEYLNQFCFDVKIENWTYYHYGSGSQRGKKVTITFNGEKACI
jgi:hypothetical protein